MKFIRLLDNFSRSLANIIPEWLFAILVRISVFMIFWPAAQTKIASGYFLGQKWAFWDLSAGVVLLFEHEYNLPLLPAEIAAYAATIGEFFLSLLVLAGLFTRISTFILLIMTVVIQVFVYPNSWALHLLWASTLLYLLKHGAGKVSLDGIMRRG
ncbi:DoxX family protein [Teredinibacter waterburyi]|jgi:DoxX.|uniref:DoxX family protein n=1 Tax=Teredinibacter waterburyi TaxID=1500538 RepID=UPI00165F3FF9|nr:DoxX family protein [Teredinibacter waterburyi]